MKNAELTTGERAALKVCNKYLDEYGVMPTMRELAEHLGKKSPNTGQRYVDQLTIKGYLGARQEVIYRRAVTAKGKRALGE
jgi:SOS-response transcriptional repressor LexA